MLLTVSFLLCYGAAYYEYALDAADCNSWICRLLSIIPGELFALSLLTDAICNIAMVNLMQISILNRTQYKEIKSWRPIEM